jgi:hypothetical protein
MTMESRIPLPTDNIYKFYALFGLLLFIFGIGASIAQIKLTNDFMVKSYIELEMLKAIEKPNAVEALRRTVTERMIDIEKSDKEVFKWGLALIAAAGFFLMIYGFGKWHSRIQPMQDELLQLQLEKLRRELAALPLSTTGSVTVGSGPMSAPVLRAGKSTS